MRPIRNSPSKTPRLTSSQPFGRSKSGNIQPRNAQNASPCDRCFRWASSCTTTYSRTRSRSAYHRSTIHMGKRRRGRKESVRPTPYTSVASLPEWSQKWGRVRCSGKTPAVFNGGWRRAAPTNVIFRPGHVHTRQPLTVAPAPRRSSWAQDARMSRRVRASPSIGKGLLIMRIPGARKDARSAALAAYPVMNRTGRSGRRSRAISAS